MSETHTLLVLYDLRHSAAWERVTRHRSYWGKSHTCVHYLEENVVVLEFRPTTDQRWRPWEDVRMSWILDEDLEGKTA